MTLLVHFDGYAEIEIPDRLKGKNMEEIWEDTNVQNAVSEIFCGDLENIDSEPWDIYED